MIGLDTNILARYYIQDKSDVIMRLNVGNGEPPPLYPCCRAEQHSQDGGESVGVV